MFKTKLNISTSPHLVNGMSTDSIMQNVVWAMLPVAAFSVYAFGINALLLLTTTTATSVLTEHYLCKISKKQSTVSDWSAVITGMLLGFTLPPNFPLWMAFCGAAIAIGLGKFVFGGLGYNVFNPALVGRAGLQAAFPAAITTWYNPFLPDRFTHISKSVLAWPFMQPQVDVISGATPLSAFKFDHVNTNVYDLAMGLTSGSAGETCGLLILLGGIYLVVRKMMNWRIPVAAIGSAFIFSGIMYIIDKNAYPSPLFSVFSGGLLLGAVFMASDMVGSPITSLGVWIYGSFIGVLVLVIRFWGGLPEGEMYAILLANAVSPHIDKLVRPRVYGTKKKLSLS